jgi:hypothetical protein
VAISTCIDSRFGGFVVLVHLDTVPSVQFNSMFFEKLILNTVRRVIKIKNLLGADLSKEAKFYLSHQLPETKQLPSTRR